MREYVTVVLMLMLCGSICARVLQVAKVPKVNKIIGQLIGGLLEIAICVIAVIFVWRM